MAYLVPKRKSAIPQREPLDSSQVQDQAGGFVYALDPWKSLQRFLILGCEGATYYASQETQVKANTANLDRCIAEDPDRVVETILENVRDRRAPKQDPLLYALARVAVKGTEAGRRAAYKAFPGVAKIGTHLFHLVAMLKAERGMGTGLRKAIARWYEAHSDKDLVFDVMKYQSRDGWSHRDVLRLAHPKVAGRRNDILNWVVKGWPSVGEEVHPDEVLARVWAFERMKRATDPKEAVELIRKYDLPRECVKTEFLNDPEVWAALLERMPMTAMIRNLGKMTEVGLLKPLSAATAKVVQGLGNDEWVRKAHVHPIQLLAALLTYGQGHGFRGKNTWVKVDSIVSALDGAFLRSFDFLEPTGKRFYIGVDVSPSMHSGVIAGVPGLTPAAGAACLALAIAKAEKPNYVIRGFSSGDVRRSAMRMYWGGGSAEMIPLGINDGCQFSQALQATQNRPWGGTDCALPMLNAMQEKLEVDCFIVITDNETHSGSVHPMEALRQYRAKTGIDAKLVVVGMTSTGFTIADARDPGCLDVVGFDTVAPRLIADFACGRV